ncbi:polyprenyl synthetase family protein [Actinomyces bowdenii]|uniref:Polyprenyl synthetase family protein n=1 Tax=Actinomyces bowdenii TaxID=131109 RepID=A0A3P1V642_9ACTO|nr:polyprenyl synthetase family protein [Actinomyces bowdenii]RRD29126.1 polyprenyl synthetase family protein [Actinomyces bowdenii]
MSDASDIKGAREPGLTAALAAFRAAVESRLDEVIEDHRRAWQDLGRASTHMLDTAALALRGGKRMRALLGGVGMSLPPGPPDPAARLAGSRAPHLGAALELYQASALVHDDVMDGALTRRGLPAAHRAFASAHAEGGWRGRAEDFGASGAILLGDLLLSLACQEMSALSPPASAQAGFPRAGEALRARAAFDAMTAEVALGQFLDVRSEVTPLPLGQDPGRAAEQMHRDALAVIRHKSARYSVQHPLLIGALLAGMDPAGRAAELLGAFGEEIGIAFQLRDDDLGVFGDPRRTGKPAGDDLREGKRTVLLALAWGRADDEGRALLGEVLANREAGQDRITAAARLIEDCGARGAHEEAIAAHRRAGARALEELGALAGGQGLEPAALEELDRLAVALTEREA